MITLTGDNGTYLNIDMWYNDEFVPGLYDADAFFSDVDGVYRGNIYNDNGKEIGDFESDDSVLVGKNFQIDWDYDEYHIEACDDIKASTKPKYTADMCSISAASSGFPYYIDKTGAFDGYFEDQTDVLSISQLQSIYDTLLSDGDISAGSFNSFDEWLKANVDAGLLSGCLMSDAQRCDMPADFGGYRDDDDIDYFSDDEVFRVIINDDPAHVEKILDECGCWYDYDGGDRLMVNMCGLNCLEDNGIDYDEV